MAVVREYRCKAHGEFESTKARCPHGCSAKFVVQEFRTPVGTRSARTRFADAAISDLASAYRLPDVRNTVDGDSVMTTLRRSPSYAPTWGQVQHAAPGFSRDPNASVPVFDPRASGVMPANVLKDVQPMLTGPRPNVVARHDAKV